MFRLLAGTISGGATIGLAWYTTANPLAASAPASVKTHYYVVVTVIAVVALLGLIAFGLIDHFERQRERRDNDGKMAGLQSDLGYLRTTITALIPPVTVTVHAVQAPQTVNATMTVQFALWPERQTLREQVIDLIQNARRSAEALRITPDEQYMTVLSLVAEPFVGPSIAIRQALRRVLGFPLAEPLNHLPTGVQAEDFDTVAEVHERLLRSIPDDAPAVPLTEPE